jgi:hypothetical protein
MEWECGWFGKVPGVRFGLWSILVSGIGLWMAWKGTSCTEEDCGWFGKVPGVEYG